MDDFSNSPALIIPIVAILMPIGVIAVVNHFKNKEREMIHRERMLAMEKGLQPPPDPGPSAFSRQDRGPRNYLLRGLIWLFVGIGVFVATYVFSGSWEERQTFGPFSLVPLSFLAFIPAGIGVAFLIYYAIENSNPRPPAP